MPEIRSSLFGSVTNITSSQILFTAEDDQVGVLKTVTAHSNDPNAKLSLALRDPAGVNYWFAELVLDLSIEVIWVGWLVLEPGWSLWLGPNGLWASVTAHGAWLRG